MEWSRSARTGEFVKQANDSITAVASGLGLFAGHCSRNSWRKGLTTTQYFFYPFQNDLLFLFVCLFEISRVELRPAQECEGVEIH